MDAVGEHFDVIGGGICGAFVFFGALSVLIYRPWRRLVEKRRIATVGVVLGMQMDTMEKGGTREEKDTTEIVDDDIK